MVLEMQSKVEGERLREEIEARLWGYEPLRALGNLLEVDLRGDGTVKLAGPVPTRVIKDGVLRTVRETPGVAHVEDGIIPDPDLEVAVARALASDERTAAILPGQISIRSHNGAITLIGQIPEDVNRAAILDVVRSVEGVRFILDKLT
jgi:osmotically-inducible protein OsmY